MPTRRLLTRGNGCEYSVHSVRIMSPCSDQLSYGPAYRKIKRQTTGSVEFGHSSLLFSPIRDIAPHLHPTMRNSTRSNVQTD
jgi:hypothetical protein